MVWAFRFCKAGRDCHPLDLSILYYKKPVAVTPSQIITRGLHAQQVHVGEQGCVYNEVSVGGRGLDQVHPESPVWCQPCRAGLWDLGESREVPAVA